MKIFLYFSDKKNNLDAMTMTIYTIQGDSLFIIDK